MVVLYQVYQLCLANGKTERIMGGYEMMTGPDLILVARDYGACCSETCNIVWDACYRREWREHEKLRPSVLDAAVLEYAPRVGPSYLEAVIAATGWNRDAIIGFNTVMLLGYPAESADMKRERMAYWMGVANGLLVYEKIKRRYG
jgi:hypothetical protein